MTKENKFKIGLCLQGIALSMDDITLKANEDRLKMIEDIIAGEQEPCSDAISRQAVLNTEYQVKDINGVDYVMLSEVQMKIRKSPSVNPQPCEDAVSRKAVKDWFCTNYCSEHNQCEHFEQGDCNAMIELFALPSVNPQKWIPVSERLPEPNQIEKHSLTAKYYLVQNEYDDMMVARWDGKGWEQMYQYEYVEDEVIAWMPLPEPYKAESEDDA